MGYKIFVIKKITYTPCYSLFKHICIHKFDTYTKLHNKIGIKHMCSMMYSWKK